MRTILLALIGLLLLTSCRDQRSDPEASAAPSGMQIAQEAAPAVDGEQPEARDPTQHREEGVGASSLLPGGAQSQPPAIKQLILIYTGDTLSAMQTVVNNNEAGKVIRLGGLSALTAEIISYKQNITAMARQRVLDGGGDPGQVRADDELGLLGGHPYMLLDYGGWERDGDPHGGIYVELMLRMFGDLKYSAVGMKMVQRLTDDEWTSYRHFKRPAGLLCSVSPLRPERKVGQQVVLREVHGSQWGIAAVPLPPENDTDPFARIQQYVEEAAAVLEKSGAEHWILLCAGGPKSLYQQLSQDSRFDVVIGVSPPGLAAAQGFGKLSSDGPLMLPELNMGGQEMASCHLIYPTDGAVPTEYNFTRHVVLDDLKSPFPYRAQVGEAIHARQKLAIYSQH